MKARTQLLLFALCTWLGSCADEGAPECLGPSCGSLTTPDGSFVGATGGGPGGAPLADAGAGGGATTGGTSPIGGGQVGGGQVGGGQAGGGQPGGAGSDAGMSRTDASVAPTDASAPADGGPAQASSGCGATGSPPAGTYMIDVSGTARQYIIALPANYDANKPYRLVFAWHGLGGTAAQIARGYYGLQTRSANSAIFVSGQGLDTAAGGAGWQNSNGQDVAFVRALYAQLKGQYCIDETRVFSVGMSYGGIMSNTLGCQMGDVFRAIAPMSGSGPGFGGRGATCMGQVAVWMSHGNTDTVVAFSQGQGSRDTWVRNNHCQATTLPVEPSPCVAYQGCDSGHPVTWCEFDGGHTIPSFASAAIWAFFSQF
jgi:polyhydroxybutyrate depolymerase